MTDAAHAGIVQQLRPGFVNEWITVMNQELGAAKKAIDQISNIASHLFRLQPMPRGSAQLVAPPKYICSLLQR